jgi:hypothetical protein
VTRKIPPVNENQRLPFKRRGTAQELLITSADSMEQAEANLQAFKDNAFGPDRALYHVVIRTDEFRQKAAPADAGPTPDDGSPSDAGE